MDKREFYAAVAAALGVDDPYVELLPYRRRWGQRKPGNGRFEGFGLVRWFSSKLIMVTPETVATRSFDSPEGALDYIKNMPRSSIGQDTTLSR